MVLVKRICPLEQRKAVIAVTASLSHPTISVNAPSDPEDPFQLRISLRIAQTTQPGRPITIRTDSTVFSPPYSSSEYDTLSRGGFGLASVAAMDGNRRHISLGWFISNKITPENRPADLKQRPFTHLLTVPAAGTVEVTHDLPISRIFRHEQRLTRDDVVDEAWEIYLRYNGYVGTTWWCWGDLDGDLREKHLHGWHEGVRPHMAQPDLDDAWVLGNDPKELIFEEDQAEPAVFRFVE